MPASRFLRTLGFGCAAMFAFASAGAVAQAVEPGRVVATGTVPDEATKASIISRLRELYGADLVVDRIGVGGVVTPTDWSTDVRQVLGAQIKSIRRGEVSIDGSVVSLKGEVASEAERQQVVSDFANALNARYTIRNALRVGAAEQSAIDEVLANRTVEFESGSAILTLPGQTVLDEVIAVLRRLPGRKVDIIGHTDAEGDRTSNIALSVARAQAVRIYLRDHGIDPESLRASGAGPDRPIASNATVIGRARNRRIEFRLGA